MNRSETEVAAKVMVAFSQGKPVQYRWRKETEWRDGRAIENAEEGTMLWNWQEKDYRISPPVPRRLYQASHPNAGLCGPVCPDKSQVLTPWQQENGFTIVTFIEELTTD